MDETTKNIIEISKDSKYVIIVPSWFSSSDCQQLRDSLEEFMNDPDRVFGILSDGFELRKVD